MLGYVAIGLSLAPVLCVIVGHLGAGFATSVLEGGTNPSERLAEAVRLQGVSLSTVSLGLLCGGLPFLIGVIALIRASLRSEPAPPHSGRAVAIVVAVLPGTFVAIGAGVFVVPALVEILDWGSLRLPLALTLFISGVRYVPAAEVALMALLETVLGPIWTWLGVGEIPAILTVVGGIIVIAAIVGNSALALRSRPPLAD